MSLQGLASLFEAALAPLAIEGVLHQTTTVDDGAGGFSVDTVDIPVKLVVEVMSEKARAASGLPADTATLTVFQAGFTGAIAVDDSISTAGTTYRVVATTMGPGGVGINVVAVPA